MSTTRLRHKKYLISLATLLLGMVLISSCDPDTDTGKGSPLGEWKITDLTGNIQNSRETGIQLLCDAFDETYNPVLGDDQSYVKFIKVQDEPDFEHIPNSVFDSYQLDSEGLVFIFHISFDNGYYTNEVLEGIGVQGTYESFFGSAWSIAIGVYSKSEIANEEIQGFSESGTSGGGHNEFKMTGNLISDTRIEGTWSWSETTVWPDINTPECNTQGSGEGIWGAIRK